MSARRLQPEAQLQRSVLEHLRWRGQPNIFFMHYPSGGYRSPVEAMVLKGLGVQPGVPDLLIVRDGRLFGLELKTERRELSDIQHNQSKPCARLARSVGLLTASTRQSRGLSNTPC